MSPLTRLLSILACMVTVGCGVAISRALLRPMPVFPAASWDDPLVEDELRQLAAIAAQGTAADWRHYGEALLGQGCYSHAEIAFRQALQLNSEDENAQFGLAFSLDRTGRMEESNTEYAKVIQLAAERADLGDLVRRARYAMGRNELRSERADAAEREFRQLPRDPAARCQVAKLLIRSGRAEAALPLLDSGLSELPRSLEFLSLRYCTLRELQDLRGAMETADRLERAQQQVAINFNNSYIEPFYEELGLERRIQDYDRLLASGNLAMLAEQLDRLRKLVAGRHSPYVRIFLIGSMEVDLKRHQPEQVLSLLGELERFGDANAEMLQISGAAQALQGNNAIARDLWQRAAQMSPNIPLFQKLAECCEALGDQPGANLARAQSHLLQGFGALSAGEPATATAEFRKSLDLNPNDPRAWFSLGEGLRLQRQIEPAQAAYERSLALDPECGRAVRRLELMSPPPESK